jgi:hypothetical protein
MLTDLKENDLNLINENSGSFFAELRLFSRRALEKCHSQGQKQQGGHPVSLRTLGLGLHL